jgi:hypothetical protein
MLEDNKWFQEILSISGVEGVLLTSQAGNVIGKIGLNFDQTTSEKIAEKIIRILLIHQKINRTVKEVEIKWANYNLVIMIKNGLILITYCSQDRIMPLLRITLNVVLAHLLEDKKFIKQIKKYLEEKPPKLIPEQLETREINLISKLQ